MKFELIAKKDGKECDLSEISTETFENLKKPKPEPKPELRHGDYGHYKDGGLWWAWKRQGCLELFGTIQGSGRPAKLILDKVIDGNFVDDLERNKVDLKEFRVVGKNPGDRVVIELYTDKHSIDNTYICIVESGHSHFSLEQAAEIHQKLGQMLAYAKRQSKQNA